MIGWAEVDFTPEPGLTLLGQMHERRGERVRDPLMASAVAVSDSSSTVVIVSVDICMLRTPFVRDVQQQFASESGLPPENLLLHSTHTHVAPSAMNLLAASAEPAFVDRLRRSILNAALQAVEHLQPGELYAGTGQMDQMGWNRRGMFSNGSSAMYGGAGLQGFIGLEGPRDPALGVLFSRGENHRVGGIILNFSTHPNTLESECFYSADIPGEVRSNLKKLFGPEVVVLYLTGAAGNTAPSILDPPLQTQPWRGEEGLQRSGLYMAGEAARTIASCVSPMPDPILRMESATLQIPVRRWPEPGERCYPEPLITDAWPSARPYYQAALEDWPRRLSEESPVEVRLTAVRIGDAVLCTNPAELFVEYGLEMRQKSPAQVTLISELTGGYVGYVPTRLAVERGGYETWPAPTSQLSIDAGDTIVEATGLLLDRLFNSTP